MTKNFFKIVLFNPSTIYIVLFSLLQHPRVKEPFGLLVIEDDWKMLILSSNHTINFNHLFIELI